MSNKIKLLPLSLVSLALVSCAYGLKDYYPGNAYMTGDFNLDTYRVWDERIDKTSAKSRIISSETIALDVDRDSVFERYNDPNFRLVDKDSYDANLTYQDDYFAGDEDYYLNSGYGPTKKMTRFDNSFRYGYLSKLFDGQMFCHGRYQAARVQIDEGGFGVLFNKETDLDTYFAINFKASYDYTKYDVADFKPYYDQERPTYNVPETKTAVDLKISFYLKRDDGYIEKTFTYPLSNISTNYHEDPSQYLSIYNFFGFRTNHLSLDRVQGFSVKFDFDRDDINKNPMRDLKDKENNPYKLDYSLMLYEVFMPNTIWR